MNRIQSRCTAGARPANSVFRSGATAPNSSPARSRRRRPRGTTRPRSRSHRPPCRGPRKPRARSRPSPGRQRPDGTRAILCRAPPAWRPLCSRGSCACPTTALMARGRSLRAWKLSVYVEPASTFKPGWLSCTCQLSCPGRCTVRRSAGAAGRTVLGSLSGRLGFAVLLQDPSFRLARVIAVREQFRGAQRLVRGIPLSPERGGVGVPRLEPVVPLPGELVLIKGRQRVEGAPRTTPESGRPRC